MLRKAKAENKGHLKVNSSVGGFYNVEVRDVNFIPEKIIFNENKTIVYWDDGTKTVSSRTGIDPFDPEIGFSLCLMKRLLGHKLPSGRKHYRAILLSKSIAHDSSAKAEMMVYKDTVKELERQDRNSKKRGKKNDRESDEFPF